MSQRGFTLMEVLVAVAILGTALAAAIRVASQAGSNTVELRERVYAGWVAENQLAVIQAGIEPLQGPTTRSGASEMGGMEWNWKLSAEEATPPLPMTIELPGLLEVEVEVYRQGEIERPVAIRTLWHQVPQQPVANNDG